MGKKSKYDKVKSKIHVKVKRQHINTAHEKLRLKYNTIFNVEVPNKVDSKVNNQDIHKEDGDGRGDSGEGIDYDKLLEKLTKILDFYRSEKITRDDMIRDGTVDPVDMAYNTLCDQGIKKTINHGQQLQIPGEKLRTLIMRAYYGRDNVTEEEPDEVDNFYKHNPFTDDNDNDNDVIIQK